MTTTITVSTNGPYVSEGTVGIEYPAPGGSDAYPIKVGPGSDIRKHFTVPHLSTVTVTLKERHATPEEVAEEQAARAAAEAKDGSQ
jgi:hypothetical protein